MNNNDCGEKIAKVDCLINDSLVLYDHYIMSVNVAIKKEQDYLIKRVNYRVGVIDVELTRCFLVLYHSANYHYCCSMFYSSPGLFTLIATIAIAVSDIILFIKNIVDILHVVELLKIAEILAVVWPAFRVKMSEIYGKISEASEQLGFGADGLIHLIQSTQSSVTILGGVLGKNDEWSEAQLGSGALDVAQRVSSFAHVLGSDPSHALTEIFREQDWKNKREVSEWWDKTSAFIDSASKTAIEGLQKVNDTIDDFIELRGILPKFIADHIPSALIAGLEWVDSQIDDTLLPAVSNINKNLQQVNDLLDQYRDKTGVILENINNPGDLLLRMDNLEEKARKIQEQRIDDAAGRLLASQADAIEKDDTDVIKELESISQLLETEVVTPIFMTIEDVPRGTLPEIVAEPFETWFVGDY